MKKKSKNFKMMSRLLILFVIPIIVLKEKTAPLSFLFYFSREIACHYGGIYPRVQNAPIFFWC